MPQCSTGGGGGGGDSLAQSQAQARSSFVDKIHGITDKLQHSLGGHLTHDPSKTGKWRRAAAEQLQAERKLKLAFISSCSAFPTHPAVLLLPHHRQRASDADRHAQPTGQWTQHVPGQQSCSSLCGLQSIPLADESLADVAQLIQEEQQFS